ncbi:hypothetical protein LguiB_009089 [Lonicera macranthoides]
MRNQWRLLLLRCNPRSQFHVPQFQVHSTPISRSISSLLHSPSPQMPVFQNPNFRCYSSSELAVEHKDSDQVVAVIDIFSKQLGNNDEIKLELERNSIVISHDLVVNVLSNPSTHFDVAKRFFDWVSEVESERLSSKSYNWMLGTFGANGFAKEFWELVGDMKRKGYGVSKGAYVRALEKFEKEGMGSDVEKLKELFASGSIDNSVEKLSSRICKVIRQEVWGDDVEKRLRELNVAFSSELIGMVLKNLETEPNKALIFFRWLEESGLFKHDARTYNALARVLGREDSVEKFWRVVDEMKEAGCEMEIDTYIEVLGQFIKSKIMKDAVDLYEFAMGGVIKRPLQECTFLLRKITVSKELDMDLFSRVVRIYKESGNTLTNSTLDAVLKSLTSVGKFGECNKVLKAMEEGGLLPSGNLQSKIAFQLSSHGKKDEASKFMENIEESGSTPDHKTWESLVEGYYVAGDLDKAYEFFQKMIEKEGVSSAGYALELLVTACCLKNRALKVFKLLSDMVNERGLKPWHTTYKELTSKLLAQGRFKEALSLIGLMKSQGYPPLLDQFIEYISKNGTADDAVEFLKEMTVKRFPSKSVFLRVFEAYFKAGRHNEAQDFLSKCPRYIRNHADVLNMFCDVKSSVESVADTAVAV